MKSDHTRSFPAHDFLYVALPSQTSSTNNKRVISSFKFGYPRLTLKEGSKVKSDIRRFAAHYFLQVGFTLQTSRTNNKGDIGTSLLCGLLWHSVDDLELRGSRSNVCKVVEDIYICDMYHL